MNIGDRIKQIRLENDMTLEELAKITGVSKPTIFRYESGEIKNIPPDKIEKLAKGLKVSPGYIMGWEENNDMSIGDRIKKRRLELGLTQEEIAKRIGYKDRTTIVKIEKGKIDLTQSKVIEFAKILHTSPTYLMGCEKNDDTTNELNNLIASNISKLMETRNVTQKELADYIGVSQASVSTWVLGIKTPRLDKIEKICKFFDISPACLIGLEEKDDKEIFAVNTDDMKNEVSKKYMLLFSKLKNATDDDLKKIIAIVDVLMGENNNE